MKIRNLDVYVDDERSRFEGGSQLIRGCVLDISVLNTDAPYDVQVQLFINGDAVPDGYFNGWDVETKQTERDTKYILNLSLPFPEELAVIDVNCRRQSLYSNFELVKMLNKIGVNKKFLRPHMIRVDKTILENHLTTGTFVYLSCLGKED